MRKKTTPETEALIIKLHLQGKTIAEIAKETGLNRSVVAQFLLVRCPETRTEAKAALINQIKAAGVDPSLSLTANAKRFGTDVLTIKAVFHDLGLPTPTQKNKQKNKQTDKILELRRNGLTYRAIAKEVGLSAERVHKIVRRYSNSTQA
jgi:DNA invertase Pin-like site-specific DNA recombinase